MCVFKVNVFSTKVTFSIHQPKFSSSFFHSHKSQPFISKFTVCIAHVSNAAAAHVLLHHVIVTLLCTTHGCVTLTIEVAQGKKPVLSILFFSNKQMTSSPPAGLGDKGL